MGATRLRRWFAREKGIGVYGINDQLKKWGQTELTPLIRLEQNRQRPGRFAPSGSTSRRAFASVSNSASPKSELPESSSSSFIVEKI